MDRGVQVSTLPPPSAPTRIQARWSLGIEPLTALMGHQPLPPVATRLKQDAWLQGNNLFSRLDQRLIQRLAAAMASLFHYETNKKTLNASRHGLMKRIGILRLTPTPTRNAEPRSNSSRYSRKSLIMRLGISPVGDIRNSGRALEEPPDPSCSMHLQKSPRLSAGGISELNRVNRQVVVCIPWIRKSK